MTDVNADFYVTAATVIPVIFLGLVLQGGLWVWLSKRIKTLSGQQTRLGAAISFLQFFALAILVANTVAEIVALHALQTGHSSATASGTVFWSAVFLLILLAISLATRIPGLVRTDLDAIELNLEDNEELHWSGLVPRLLRPLVRTRKIFGMRFEMANPAPMSSGKMFITDKRLVWLPPGEMGLLGGRRIEIRAGEFASIQERRPSGLSWLRSLWRGRFLHLLVTLVFSPIEVGSTDGRSFTFYVSADHAEIMPFLTALRGAEPPGDVAAQPGQATG
jgi:hypothetical protein